VRSSTLLLISIFLILSATGNAIEVEGDVWGVWTPDHNPYLVVGEVRVPPESTLTIEPGVLVNFQGHFKFMVDSTATLTAIGTEGDSIIFTTDDPSTGWRGIRFFKSNSSSQLSYCRIEYGKATGTLPDKNGGAVFCYQSGITISHNRITLNSAEGDGGGVFSESCSSLTISDNLIIENSAESGHGGGIFSEHCDDLSIINNTISDNSALRGGAIQCVRNINVTVRDNTVNGNSTLNSGAGIRFQAVTDALISRNLVFGNWTLNEPGGNGAGIYTRNCGRDVIVSGNIVTENVAAGRGGGFFCRNARTTLINNSAAGNSAALGGGIACREYAHPLLVNTILWSDSAGSGPEICLLNMNSDPCTLSIAYCDVDGGMSGVRIDPGCVLNRGEGNLVDDPIFVDPHRYDLNLRWRSPCIDAGDPYLPLDPDGTRSDIGAFYFNQDVDGIIELYPHDTPIVIPPEGGDIIYDGWVFNFLGHPRSTDIWMFAFVPETGQYGPIHLYENVRLPNDSLGMNHITEHLPGVAPAGEYVFVSYVGDYPTIIDSSYFYFTKSASVGGVIAPWLEGEGWFKELSSAESNLPTDYALSQNYPNPFNATTTINYQLPADGYVKLEAYNTLGQKVATLADSKQQAGYRSVIWDASEFSSGIYFYKLTAGDFKETKKVMLIK
jgi:hypothetical protein